MFNYSVKEYLGLKPTKGDVGIEIEMETEAPMFDAGLTTKSWRTEIDNSLKNNGTEFVLKSPVPFHEVGTLMETFRKDLKAAGIKILPTIRAGVHIHINMQEHTINDVIRFMACYYAMETALTRFCGDGREGNLFCLRARDAEYSILKLEDAIVKKDFLHMKDQNLRYAACNIQSLFQYGSVEFRAFGTNPTLKGIEEWVGMLRLVKEYSLGVVDIWDDLATISADGGFAWIKKILGDEYAEMLFHPELEYELIQDVRNIQHLCHLMRKGKI